VASTRQLSPLFTAGGANSETTMNRREIRKISLAAALMDTLTITEDAQAEQSVRKPNIIT